MSSTTLLSGTLSPRRRKQATYGKQSRTSLGRSEYDLDQFASETLDQDVPITPRKSVVRSTAIKRTDSQKLSVSAAEEAPVCLQEKSHIREKPRQTQSTLTTVKSQPQSVARPTPTSHSVDIFDIPSEDEAQERPAKPRPSGTLTYVSRRVGSRGQELGGGGRLQVKVDSTGLSRPSKRPRLSGSSEPDGEAPLQNRPEVIKDKAVRAAVPAPVRSRRAAQTTPKTAARVRDLSIAELKSPELIERKTIVGNSVTDSKRSPVDGKLARTSDKSFTYAGTRDVVPLNAPAPIPRPPPSPPTVPSTPPRPTIRREASISTTPKQAALWDALLSDPQESPQLQLSPALPRSALLRRTTTGRSRLIDTLIPAVESSDAVEEIVDHKPNNQSEISTTAQDSQDSRGDELTTSQHTYRRVQSKFTYGGQRSFLEEQSFALAAENDVDTRSTQSTYTATASGLAKDWPSQQQSTTFDFSVPDAEEDSQGMRSIHELRAAADSFQFDNDLLFDDLERIGKDNFSRKRTALLEICTKLGNKSYRERFIQNGLELRVVNACRAESDTILNSVVAGITVYALSGSISSQLAAQLTAAGAIEKMISLLPLEKELASLAKDRRNNMSKVAQSTTADLQKSLSSSAIWGETNPKILTPRLLGLKAWELLVRKMRKDGDISALVTRLQLENLLSLLEQKVHRLESIDFKPGPDDRLIVEILLSLLESLTIAEACSTDLNLWNSSTLTKLVSSLNTALSVPDAIPQQARDLILRICLNLANNHEANSEAFSNPSFITKLISTINEGFIFEETQRPADSNPAALDRLILTLGAMLNLAEWSEPARLFLLENPGNLDSLLQHFTTSRGQISEADSLASSSQNVAHGYLAVLLGNLCKSPQIRAQIQAKLPNGSFAVLRDAVEEFLRHHKEADRVGEGNNSWVAFTQRLARVCGMLGELTGRGVD